MSKHSESLKRMHLVLAIALCALLTFTFLQTENSITGAVTSNGNSTGSVLAYLDSVSINSTTPSQNSTNDNITAHITSNANKDIINWYLNDSSIATLNVPFEKVDNTDTNNAQDYSPNNHTATFGGSPTWNAAGGFDGNGTYEFDGVDDYINFSSGPSIGGTSNFAVMAWVKTSSSDGMTIINQRSPGFDGEYILNVGCNHDCLTTNPGQVYFMVYGDSNFQFEIWSSNQINDGQWHHIVAARNGEDGYLFIDGQVNNFSSGTIRNLDQSFETVIGANVYGGTSQVFNGSIDEVMVLNVSTAPDQVANIYANNTRIVVSDQTSVDDMWSFCATPNGNGADGTSTCSENLTVLSTTPSIDSAAINSTTPTINSTFDNVTSHVTTSDPNGDEINLIYNWQRNGSEIVALNIPFERVDRTETSNAYDYAIDNNHGVESLSIEWNQTGGYLGSGTYNFDGVDDSITVSDLGSLRIPDQITLSAWVQPNRAGHGDWETIMMKGSDQTLANQAFDYNLRISDDGKAQFSVNTSSGYYTAESTNVLYNNSWTLVTGVYNGTDTVIYLNGTNDGSTTASGTITTSNDDLKIGGFGNDNFQGQIDDVAIFNIALDESQINSIYQNKLNLITSGQTRQLENWSFCVIANDGWENSKSSCSQNVTINAIPTIPAIESIANNSARTNRSAPFRWNSSTESDGEQVTYQLQVSNETDFSTLFVDQSLIPDNETSQSNFTSNNDLPVDTTFYWRARAYDGKEYSDWSEYYEFQVLSSNVIAVPSSAVNFGEINATSDKNTTDAAYDPIILINDGNIPIDVYMNSSQMFTDANSLWQYQIEENETGAYVSANETWTNFTIDANDTLFIYSLLYENFTNAANAANIHILAQVANSESPGAKASTIYIRTEASS